MFQVSTVTPYKSVKDVIDYAKANPGKLNYYSVGIGSTSHLSTVLFMDVTGTKMQHVPYSQMAQGITDVLTGRTEINFGPMGSSIGNIREGKMRALALTGPVRAKLLPEVPTLTELGIKMGEEFELVRVLRAQGHAAADHRQDQPRSGDGPGAARDEGARDPARLSLHRRLAGKARHAPEERNREMGCAREKGRVQVTAGAEDQRPSPLVL